ncbi:DUF1684 domain-containing protein [Nocardioides zeae]|uniref:DUF1684 domain-containing protein n=1 Tax=Nocardioides imazamoxiresistens TaxID=3231893 RepID=A0ABU3Q0N1_9ACTN|nr:DUF1684 domain-containing protein [Nocardioides zeae]MDT9594991.1 DUF1684 domain-containing protein [Nocardioides zeae]
MTTHTPTAPSPATTAEDVSHEASWEVAWHGWAAERDETITAPHGVASATGTHWLGAEPTEVPGLPGRWWAEDGQVRGETADVPVRIAPGARLALGERVLTALAPGGALAVRVLDPAAPTRTSLTGVVRHDPDPAWVLTGRFVPAAADATLPIEHADGRTTDDPVVGTVEVEVAGSAASLVAFGRPGGLQVTFGDASNGDGPEGAGSVGFRFLSLPEPAADGTVTVDLNRAYLPPCVFTDHYLCPLPPPQNRLPVRVAAGERWPTYA